MNILLYSIDIMALCQHLSPTKNIDLNKKTQQLGPIGFYPWSSNSHLKGLTFPRFSRSPTSNPPKTHLSYLRLRGRTPRWCCEIFPISLVDLVGRSLGWLRLASCGRSCGGGRSVISVVHVFMFKESQSHSVFLLQHVDLSFDHTNYYKATNMSIYVMFILWE